MNPLSKIESSIKNIKYKDDLMSLDGNKTITEEDDLRASIIIRSSSNSGIIVYLNTETCINVSYLIDFEDRITKNTAISSFMAFSPSIPSGFDLNCTHTNLNDLSTIIC